MKTRPWIAVPAMAALFVGAACQSAHTEASGEPQVVTVPVDEMTSDPAMPVYPAIGDTTPAAAQPPAPQPAAPKKASYNSVNVDGPYIAMTFDDGPRPGQTDRLLDMLKERGIRATFYVVGKNVVEYPALIQRMVAEGHEVANHSWDHPSFTKLSAAGLESQIVRTDDAIMAAGAPRPTTVRPPYGATNASINRRLNDEFGKAVIMWSVDPLDWKIRKSSHVTQQILANTKAGGIVLAHDIHPSTVDAMPATLDGLLAKGFKFVTVAELLTMDRPAAAPATAAATR